MFARLLLALFALTLAASAALAAPPTVRMTTNVGVFELELDPERAPLTVENFLSYVRDGHYDGTIFHRTIANFMIQGGGFDADLERRPARESIQNEADNGLKNLRGTIAMARTGEPHSAQAQFFINVVDNGGLDHSGKTQRGWGYAVFGKVSSGMDVVDQIRSIPTAPKGYFQNLPTQNVIIQKAEIIEGSGG